MAKPQKAQNSAKAAAKKRVVKVDAAGEVRISATFNNIIISLYSLCNVLNQSKNPLLQILEFLLINQ